MAWANTSWMWAMSSGSAYRLHVWDIKPQANKHGEQGDCRKTAEHSKQHRGNDKTRNHVKYELYRLLSNLMTFDDETISEHCWLFCLIDFPKWQTDVVMLLTAAACSGPCIA